MDGIWVVRLNFDNYQIVAICKDKQTAERWVKREVAHMKDLHIGGDISDYEIYFRSFNEVDEDEFIS
jgi:hypothetical protein